MNVRIIFWKVATVVFILTISTTLILQTNDSEVSAVVRDEQSFKEEEPLAPENNEELNVEAFWPAWKTRNIGSYIQKNEKPIREPELEIIPDEKFVAIFVTSAIENVEKRNIIRDTWGSTSNHAKLVFVLGRKMQQEVDNLVDEESNTFKDILIEPFYDSYMNLTLKSMAIMKYATSLQETYQDQMLGLLKTDDNCFVNTRTLYKTVESMKSGTIIGRIVNSDPQNRLPILRGKGPHSVPRWMYPQRHFPPFAIGSGYIISPDLVPCIWREGLKTPLIHMEDVFITGIIGNKRCNAKLIFSRYIKTDGIERLQQINPNRDIVIHHVDDRQSMNEIFKYV